MYRKRKGEKYIGKHYRTDTSYKLWPEVINNQEGNKEHKGVWKCHTGFFIAKNISIISGEQQKYGVTKELHS